MYELEDHNVLRSAAYLDTVKYQPSPQRTKIGTSRVGRNFMRNAYRQIFPVHTNPIEQTAAMLRFCKWGGSTCPPRSMRSSTPGTIRSISRASGGPGARRFVAVEGQPRYLTLYEFEHGQVSESEAWSRAHTSNPWTRRVQPNLRHDEGRRGFTGVSTRNSMP
jgi:hypothetical protein